MSGGISVLIVTWNSEDYIGACLQSLMMNVARPLEIIVVDNCSSDKTTEIVSGFSNAQLIETGANLGFAPAMNIAMQCASNPFVCLLNPDTAVLPSALDRLASFLEENPSTAAVGPRLIDDTGVTEMGSARHFPSLGESIVRQFWIAKIFSLCPVFGQGIEAEFLSQSPASVPAVSGAALMIRKSWIEQVGMLDETIPMYFEDLDYCARLRRKGSICYLPDAVVSHWGAKSADAAPVRKLLYAMENGEAPFLFLQRYRSKFSARAYVGVTMLGSLFRLALLIPASSLARFAQLSIAPNLEGLAVKSGALLWWSFIPRKRFQELIRSFFRPGNTQSSEVLQRLSAISKEDAS